MKCAKNLVRLITNKHIKHATIPEFGFKEILDLFVFGMIFLYIKIRITSIYISASRKSRYLLVQVDSSIHGNATIYY